MAEIIKDLAPAPARLSDEQLLHFENNGYVAFRDVISRSDIEGIREAMERVCLKAFDGIDNGGYTAQKGQGNSNYSGWRISERGGRFTVHFEPSIDIFKMDREEISQSFRKLAFFTDKAIEFQALEKHPILTAYRDQLLGPESTRFQDMALSKPAHFGVEKPWHQDNAYFKYTPLDAILGIWIAIDDAYVDNGCMHVLPRSRLDLAAHKHIHVTDCEISREDIDASDVRAIEIPAGGALFFFGMLPHQTPPNRSDFGRRALQLHYRGANTVLLDEEAYNEQFKTTDGRPGACYIK